MRKTDIGKYTVREGDTPASVAVDLLNDPKLAVGLVETNGGDWVPGDTLDVPGFTGTLVVAAEGEQVGLLARKVSRGVGATPAVVSSFLLWNGGTARKVVAGDEVFFVDPRRVSGF